MGCAFLRGLTQPYLVYEIYKSTWFIVDFHDLWITQSIYGLNSWFTDFTIDFPKLILIWFINTNTLTTISLKKPNFSYINISYKTNDYYHPLEHLELGLGPLVLCLRISFNERLTSTTNLLIRFLWPGGKWHEAEGVWLYIGKDSWINVSISISAITSIVWYLADKKQFTTYCGSFAFNFSIASFSEWGSEYLPVAQDCT